MLVWDQTEPCPYLPGRLARMPMRLPLRPLTPTETDEHLALGDRRHGRLLYRPTCATCRACEAVRLDVQRFRPGRTQRRALRRGDAVLDLELGEPELTDERLALYEKHKQGRGLLGPSVRPLDADGYYAFLVDRCVHAFEIRYRLEGRLVGVAVTDRGASALSAVYCYFDPELPRLSIGTYSILKQVDLCRRWELDHLYLGLYIADNRHMSYKSGFVPHERLVDGRWQQLPSDRE